jgi:hypothetical protein
VRKSPEVVCALHRGITSGILAKLDPGAELVRSTPAIPRRRAAWSKCVDLEALPLSGALFFLAFDFL